MPAYVDMDTHWGSAFDPTVLKSSSLVRTALFDTMSQRFFKGGTFYRWLTNDIDSQGRVVYPTRPANASEPWLDETLVKIARFRGAVDNWDGMQSLAPNEALFPMAQRIAELFSAMPVSWRPTLNFDPDGQPNFAAHNDDIYLTVTIEDVDKLSWYAVKNGIEKYRDDVTFNDFDASIFVDQFEVA